MCLAVYSRSAPSLPFKTQASLSCGILQQEPGKSLASPKFFFLLLIWLHFYIYVCVSKWMSVYVHTHTHTKNMCGGQRTMCRRWFSLSSICDGISFTACYIIKPGDKYKNLRQSPRLQYINHCSPPGSIRASQTSGPASPPQGYPLSPPEPAKNSLIHSRQLNANSTPQTKHSIQLDNRPWQKQNSNNSYGSPRSNSGNKAWQQVFFPTEPSWWPYRIFLIQISEF